MKQLFLVIIIYLAFLDAPNIFAQSRQQADTTGSTATIIDKGVSGMTTDLKAADETLLYPNPATHEINIIYSPGADIKSIAVYNIIGRVLTVYKVTDSISANLNLEGIPSGVYFVRLFNSNGEAVVTKKFTKQ